MKYTTYLFDFDGTLVDSMWIFETICLRILEKNGAEYNEGDVNIIRTKGYPEVAEYLAGRFDFGMNADEIYALMRARILAEYENTVPAKKNVIEVIKALKKAGASLNILTSSPRTRVEPCMKRLGFDGYFENVWTRDEVGFSKDTADLYRTTAEKLGKRAGEILFCDDNRKFLALAASVGMKTCGVYDARADKYTDEIKNKADYYVYDFGELLNIVK